MESVSKLIFLSHFLSAWGDRMWTFATGIYLVALDGNRSLLLASVQGLVLSSTVLLFGGIVGNWIDCTPRLRVARVLLIIQNSLVIVCAGLVCMLFSADADFTSFTRGFLLVLLIILCAAANLASVGQKNVLQKDWVATICFQNDSQLAYMNAMMKRIYLVTMVAAPAATGLVMSVTSHFISAICIAIWNFMSVFVEYFVLYKVYKTYPRLSHRRIVTEMETLTRELSKLKEDEVRVALDASPAAKTSVVRGVSQHLAGRLSYFYKGWSIYFRQSVKWAGIGLGLLYMTVLGWDYITVGYLKTRNLSETWIGVVNGIGAFSGFCGTLAFEPLRRRFGIARTGVISFLCQLFSALFCGAAILIRGSDFLGLDDFTLQCSSSSDPTTIAGTNVTTVSPFNQSYAPSSQSDLLFSGTTTLLNTTSAPPDYYPSATSATLASGTASCGVPVAHLVVFVIGLVLTRAGLYSVDITINHIILQNVAEHERGVVTMVQTSFEMMIDILKFCLVIALPTVPLFGLTVFASILFIVMAFASYTLGYARFNKFYGLSVHATTVHDGESIIRQDGPVPQDEMVADENHSGHPDEELSRRVSSLHADDESDRLADYDHVAAVSSESDHLQAGS